jgi:hypothetical protein
LRAVGHRYLDPGNIPYRDFRLVGAAGFEPATSSV